MKAKPFELSAVAFLLIAGMSTAGAAAGDAPIGSMDLGGLKPKSDAPSGTNQASTPIGQSPLNKAKPTTEAGAAGPGGIGSSIKTPLGSKGILGDPVTGGKTSQPAQDDSASSNDVVVKLPSNMKK